MSPPVLIAVSPCPASLAQRLGARARPGPATAHVASWVVQADDVVAFVQHARDAHPLVAIAVHRAPVDAIGFSHAARVLLDAAPGTTLLTRDAASLFPDARPQGRRGITGSLRRVSLYTLGEGVLERSPRVPGRPALSVGRDADRDALLELFALGIRVIAVSGAAGVGKSHLLNLVANALADRGERVVYADLEGHEAFGSLAVVGRELGIATDGRLEADHLLRRMAAGIDRSPVEVLVLDHVPRVALPVLGELVRRTSVRWVFGGVRRVGAGSEVTYELHPLRRRVDDVSPAAALLASRAPDLGPMHGAIAEVLEGHPLAVQLVAGWSRDAHPLALFEWLSVERRSLEDIARGAMRALPDELRARLIRLSVWPDALGVPLDDPEVVALIERGWLRTRADLAVPGLPSIRMQPLLRDVVRAEHEPPPDSVDALHAWVATQSEAMSRMLHQAREPSVFDVVSAWVPTLDQLLTQLLGLHPLTSTALARIAPVLELRVACGTRLGSVDRVLEGLERALQGAGARFDLDPLVVIRLFEARGEAFLHRREWDRAKPDLERALALAERRGEQAHAARIHLLLARVALGRQSLELAEHHLQTAAEQVTDDQLWRAEIPLTRGIVASARGDHDAAQAHLAEADARAVEAAPSLRARLCTEWAVVQRRTGRHEEALATYARAVDLWGRSGRLEEQATTMFQLALVHHGSGDLDEAERLLGIVGARAAASGEDARRALVLVQQALVHLERGHRASAQGALVEAVSAARLGGDRAGQGTARGFLALLHHLRGDHTTARDGYRLALRDLESGQDRRYGALFHCLLGAAEAELGNLGEARMLVDMARLRLPDAEPAMREAIGLFERVVDVADALRRRAEGEPDAGDEAFREVDDALAGMADRADNIYVRFAKRYLQDLVKETA
jgi:tetratricopeptide (TPR) repeat protein